MATWDSIGKYKNPDYPMGQEALGAAGYTLPSQDLMADIQRYMAAKPEQYQPFANAGERDAWVSQHEQPQQPSLAMKAVMEQFGGDMGAYNQWHGAKPPSLQKRIDSWPKALEQLKRERTVADVGAHFRGERAAPTAADEGVPEMLRRPEEGGGGASWPAPAPTVQLRGGRSAREVMDAHSDWVAQGRPDTPRGSPRSARETMDAYGQWAGGGMVGEIPQGTDEGIPKGLQRPGFSPERSSRQIMDAYKQWAATEEGPAFTGMTGEIPQGTIEGIPEGLQRPGFSPERSPRQIMDAYAEWLGPQPYTEGRFEFPYFSPPEPGLLPLSMGALEMEDLPQRREMPKTLAQINEEPQTMSFGEDLITPRPSMGRLRAMATQMPPGQVGPENDMDFTGMGAGTLPMSIGSDPMALPPMDMSQGIPRGGPYGQPGLLGNVQGPGLEDIRFQQPHLQGPGLEDLVFPQRPMDFSGMGAGIPPMSIGPNRDNGSLQTLNHREMLRKRRANEKFSKISRGY